MQNYHSSGSCALFARDFAALGAVAAIGLGLMASTVQAAPFAYVANFTDGTVSVIDTPANTVVATIPVGSSPFKVAVTPDGKHVYVTNYYAGTVTVIDTASNMVVATIPVGSHPYWVAVTPDGKHAYIANFSGASVSVIDTASNTVVATIPLQSGAAPVAIAIAPDGKHVYVTSITGSTISVIATATNTVVATVSLGIYPGGIAITPDGKRAYVTDYSSYNVYVIAIPANAVVATIPMENFLTSPLGIAITPDGKHAYVTGIPFGAGYVAVIDTPGNTVVATIPLETGSAPEAIAITPDGKCAYVANAGSNNVLMIDTASNTVGTAGAGNTPDGVGIVPPPPGIPFLAFNAQLAIQSGSTPNHDAFDLHSQFTLSSTAPGIHPVIQPVTLQVGTFSITIPPWSFTKHPDGSFTFAGVIHGVNLQAQITPAGTLRYVFHAAAQGASLTGTKNPAQVSLIAGGDSGTTSVNATNLGGLGVALR